MHANHSARAHARRARFAAETRGICAVINRKLFLRQNLFAMDVRYWRFSGRDEIEMTELVRVITLGDAVVLILELRKLSHAFKTFRPDHERWRHLRVAVLARVQIKQELNQGSLQLRAPIGVKKKPTARQLC